MVLNPLYILSAMVAVIMEVGIVALFIFLLQTIPYEIKQDAPIEITLSDYIPEKTLPVEVQQVLPTQDVVELPDPVFEQILSFQPMAPIVPQKSITYLPQVSEETAELEPQSQLFELPATLPVTQKIGAPVKRYSTVVREGEYRTIKFEELKDYAFPNYDEVAASLQKDYNELLKKPGLRRSSLTGEVAILLKFEKTGFPIVELITSISPELTNIVLRNMKLLRSGQTQSEMVFQVKVGFKAE